MGGGPLGTESLPVPLLEEEFAGGVGVELGVAGGFCGGAGVELAVDPLVEPLGGCVL
jgi:hypothetical protein